LLDVTILSDGKNEAVDFGAKDVHTLAPEAVKALLAEAGLLALFRQRPYDRIVNPADVPRDIFVSAFDSAPLAPDFEYCLKVHEADFQTGLDALAALTTGKVYLGICANAQAEVLRKAQNVTVVAFDGPHPAGNVGVQINHIRPVNKGEVVWTLCPHDVIIIGRVFNKGTVDLTRLVALTGSEVQASLRAYYPLLPGASIQPLVKNKVTLATDLRYISGNVLTGTRVAADGALHADDTQITVIPEGDTTHELVGWMLPDFFRNRQPMDARIKGGRRAMIMSNEFDKVFPMDILPEFLLRAILAQDIDKMENLGIYEVAPEDFALCEYVDTSKMELQKLVRAGLDWLYKEMM
jgi:Na+-transporting NADH:ubiquinone oxidoreductase subunit A